jgi:transposase
MTPAEDAPRTAPSHEAATPAALAEENARLRAGNAALQETIAVLLARVAELEHRLGLNSSNSGKPPTGCPSGSRAVCASGPANRPAGRRRRDLAPGRRSDRHHRSLPRDLCGLALTMATRCSARQVFDLPEPLIVTEHRAYRCRCGRCGGETRALFPEGVTAPVQ